MSAPSNDAKASRQRRYWYAFGSLLILSGLVAVCARGPMDPLAPGSRTLPREPVEVGPPPYCLVEQTVAERQELVVDIPAACPGPDDARWFVFEAPPGARYDPVAQELRFRPTFIQGGHVYQATIEVRDEELKTLGVGALLIRVHDTIQPPPITIVGSTRTERGYLLDIALETDSFLDSPGNSGRIIQAQATVPFSSRVNSKPVEIAMHGFRGRIDLTPVPYEFRIGIYDPDDTYWWGYSRSLPDGEPSDQDVQDYTLRKVLHLLEWLLESYPAADPDRVYAHGSSMGGAGALTLGLRYPRHIAWVSSFIGQTIPRNHRPARVRQLSWWWGDPSPLPPDGEPLTSTWDEIDLTRLLRDSPGARDQFVFTKHGKDDPVIHFGAVVQPSPLTGLSFYDALQEYRAGHYCVWDEGGHGSIDPELVPRWWHTEWHPMMDDTTRLGASVPFVAFSRSSRDDDPGGFEGNGNVEWDDSSGFAGDDDIPGDTGWAGDLAGTINRGLRWSSDGVVDTVERFEIPLRVVDGEGETAPQEGYPCLFDELCQEPPILVDVTPRRLQRFQLRPGEAVDWTFGAQYGHVEADRDGTVTVERLPITPDWETLVLIRK